MQWMPGVVRGDFGGRGTESRQLGAGGLQRCCKRGSAGCGAVLTGVVACALASSIVILHVVFGGSGGGGGSSGSSAKKGVIAGTISTMIEGGYSIKRWRQHRGLFTSSFLLLTYM